MPLASSENTQTLQNSILTSSSHSLFLTHLLVHTNIMVEPSSQSQPSRPPWELTRHHRGAHLRRSYTERNKLGGVDVRAESIQMNAESQIKVPHASCLLHLRVLDAFEDVQRLIYSRRFQTVFATQALHNFRRPYSTNEIFSANESSTSPYLSCGGSS